MSKPWHIWITFGICLGVIAAVMTWLTVTTRQLESLRETDRIETELARREAELQERINSSLYRMDLEMLPIISQEAARPPSDYVDSITSPLATPPPLIRLHFQVSDHQTITSPQRSTTELALFASTMDTASLHMLALANDPVASSEPTASLETANNAYSVPAAVLNPEQGSQDNKLYVQQSRGTQRAYDEYENRRQSTNVVANTFQSNNIANRDSQVPIFGSPGTMRPVWIDDQLLLVRRVSQNGQSVVQGCWMNWPNIKATLLDRISDLVADADLLPQLEDQPSDASRSLTTLPLQLAIDEPAALAALAIDSSLSSSSRSGLRTSLVIAWMALALAALATAFLIHQILKLSERRAAFVSAVTHELRTPLTTFRMYAEMLAEDMVPAEKKRHYAETLRTQADRLSMLVENVLQFARLERSPQPLPTETLGITAMLARFEDRLIERAAQAGLVVSTEFGEEVAELDITTQPAAVEQIIFNLVDNACKYGVPSKTQRITITATSDDGTSLTIRVRDDGPGNLPTETSKLFRPFHKSDQDAANTAPGVGLGLALSRRLAQSIGGTLDVDPIDSGACFALSLPIRQ